MNLVAFHGNDHGFRLEATAERRGAGELLVRFRLSGPLDTLVWPAPTPFPEQRDELWEHTCFEAFVSQLDSTAYTEWNFAPNGDWQAYAFKGYRDRLPPSMGYSPPRIRWERGRDAFTLEATIPITPMASWAEVSPLKIGLTAVLEHAGGKKTYWALRHAAAKPDFHLADSFMLTCR